MAKPTQPEEGSEVYFDAWRAQLQFLISQHLQNPLLLEVKYELPAGILVNKSRTGELFINLYKKSILEDMGYSLNYYLYNPLDKDSNYHRAIYLYPNYTTFPMKLALIKNPRHNTSLQLQLNFKATIKPGVFIDTNTQFLYKWSPNNPFITIGYSLSSDNLALLEENMNQLLDEYYRFTLIYTEEGKKILNSLV